MGRESLVVRPQALDQWKSEPLKEANSWLSELSMSSNILQFRSLHRRHIKHNGAKFQMLDKCFPGQFHQPKRVSITDLGKTHKIPKDLKTKLHNRWALPQWSSKWSTISPLQWHIMHQSTKSIHLPLKLSHVRILSHTAIHTKKETCRGALTVQTPFEGKIMSKRLLNLL